MSSLLANNKSLCRNLETESKQLQSELSEFAEIFRKSKSIHDSQQYHFLKFKESLIFPRLLSLT